MPWAKTGTFRAENNSLLANMCLYTSIGLELLGQTGFLPGLLLARLTGSRGPVEWDLAHNQSPTADPALAYLSPNYITYIMSI